GNTAALEMIIFRLIQGVGAGFLFANSTAILIDAFPSHQRGMAMGIHQVAAIVGSLAGLILGGILATINWRMVFLVSVPIGIFGTIWAYLMLRETATPHGDRRIDWPGNLTFADGLGQSRCHRGDCGGHSAAAALCLDRAAQRSPDVPAGAFPHPHVLVRQPERLSLLAGAGRPTVHDRHLAPGYLAAAARLHVRGDAALGGHLYDS